MFNKNPSFIIRWKWYGRNFSIQNNFRRNLIFVTFIYCWIGFIAIVINTITPLPYDCKIKAKFTKWTDDVVMVSNRDVSVTLAILGTFLIELNF